MSDSSVAELLDKIEFDDSVSTSELLPLVYTELRQVASHLLRNESPGQTLNPTALVHEAFIKLNVGGQERSWRSKGQFFGAAAESMRRILVDAARRRKSAKRGGNLDRDFVDCNELGERVIGKDILEIDEALREFEVSEPKKAELVKLRYFAGLSLKEIALVLDISRSTADNWWAYSKAWFAHKLAEQ